jgi:prepilin-type processing-associated H-X9-DG protein
MALRDSVGFVYGHLSLHFGASKKELAFMSRKGASLLETLVVITIMITLLGLLLPGIQKIRSASIKTHCSSNIRQIALASAMHHDTEGHLPSSVSSRASNTPFFSWLGVLLNHVEQDALYRKADSDYKTNKNPFQDEQPHSGMSTVVPLFVCPSDDRNRTAWKIHSYGKYTNAALLSYLGNSGSRFLQNDGIFHQQSATRFSTVSDGLSQTILVGERPASADMRYGWWYAGVGLGDTGMLDVVMSARAGRSIPPYPNYQNCLPGADHFQQRKVTDYCGVFHYWSLHSGGANFAFCDGSVRFLRYEADEVLPKLMTRAGGEVVSWD